MEAPDAGGNAEAPSQLTAVDALPILLVDDRAENLRALEAVLAPLGYPLETATSGREALRKLLERDFGLILLDVRMPGLDGLETAALIKARPRTREIPIVFLTAERSELGDMLLGYGVGAVDYVMKPFDPELLRSKVAVFAELEAGRRALKRSEAFLRGAFEAAPIGKTVLDSELRIVRSNPAFARLLNRDPDSLQGVAVAELAHQDERDALLSALYEIAGADVGGGALRGAVRRDPATVDVRLMPRHNSAVWVEAVVSSIEIGEHADSLLLVQWVDLTARRRVEQARAELLMEQSARTQAEATAERLQTLQTFSDALDSLALDELISELAVRAADLFAVEFAEVEVETEDELEPPLIARASEGRAQRAAAREDLDAAETLCWREAPLYIERTKIGALRLALSPRRALSPTELALLREVSERAALSIRRAQLHEQERRIAEELQRGLLPKRLPELAHVELAAHYQAAGLGAEAGGDWYDAFALPGDRIGIVVGDVTGRGIQAASTMGQLRSVTRAFALGEEGARSPGEVLTRLNRYQLALAEVEMFTVVYAIVDPGDPCISWASAGHPPPLLRSSDHSTRYLEGGNELMGMGDLVYETYTTAVAAGSCLILYSDGLVERRGESLDAGLDRFANAAGPGPDSAPELCRHLLASMLPDGAALHDDVTAILARVLPASA